MKQETQRRRPTHELDTGGKAVERGMEGTEEGRHKGSRERERDMTGWGKHGVNMTDRGDMERHTGMGDETS